MARLLLFAFLCLTTGGRLSAAPPKVTELGVDFVSVKSGPKLYGAIVQQSDAALTIAVQRDWLKKHAARYYDKQVEVQSAAAPLAVKALQDRIARWQQERAGDKILLAFLAKEHERLSQVQPAEQTEPPRFMLIELARSQVDRVYVQTPQRKQVAVAAWAQKLSAVEESSAAKLAEELRQQGVDFTKPVDLTSELPSKPDTDRQWSARQALIEFQLRKSVTFQGTTDVVFRTDAEKPDITKVIKELFESQIKSEIASLLGGGGNKPQTVKFTDKALKSSQETTAKEQASGFRVTRLAMQLERKLVTVEGRFMAKMPDGTWETVWQHTESIDASKPRDDLEQQLAKHPEVQQLLDVAKTKGLGISEEQLKLALRCGAATMAAQESVDTKFFEFFERYTQHLDGPALWLVGK